MKKLIILAISILFAISLSSCASTSTNEPEAEITPTEVTQMEETPAEAAASDGATFQTYRDLEAKEKQEEATSAENYEDPRRVINSGQRPNAFTECGLGAIIFNNQYWNLWPLAITGNIIWDIGLTGSTSSSSSPETCTGVKLKTAKLILETLPDLEKDIALGRGKHLTALHETMGCNIIHQNKINSRLRVSYADIVNDESYKTKSDIDRASDLYDTVKEVTSSFKGICKVIL